IANADARYLPYVLPLMVLAGGGLWFISRKLNLMALGREAAVN
ncbi:enterochelin ABC transporter permease, partial [Brevibacterium paucivorans]